jgi:hypothetical protein
VGAPFPRYRDPAMSRPTRFESFRFLGDKRTQIVYDLDLVEEAGLADTIDELMASEQFAAFGPDTLAEARNRGYRPHRSIRTAEESAARATS